MFKKDLKKKVLTDWLAIDLIVFGKPVRKSKYGLDLKDWFKVKKEALLEKYRKNEVEIDLSEILDEENLERIAELKAETALDLAEEFYAFEDIKEEEYLTESAEQIDPEAATMITVKTIALKQLLGELNSGVKKINEIMNKIVVKEGGKCPCEK